MRIRMRPWSLAAGLLFAWGCSGSKAEVRGKAPVGTTITVAALARQPANGAVTLRGTMVEKWPAAGCWFILQDRTGRVRVDLKSAGFVVTDLPLGRSVAVGGTVRRPKQKGEAAEPEVIASGARFE